MCDLIFQVEREMLRPHMKLNSIGELRMGAATPRGIAILGWWVRKVYGLKNNLAKRLQFYITIDRKVHIGYCLIGNVLAFQKDVREKPNTIKFNLKEVKIQGLAATRGILVSFGL